MRPTIRALIYIFLIAWCCPGSLLADGTSPTCTQGGALIGGDSSRDGLRFAKKPIFLMGSCSVNRGCDYGFPTNIYCSSSAGNCSSGPDYFGWVECDGVRSYCSPPATCTGSCFSSVQCYAICSGGGEEPVSYLCDQGCCRCYYHY
jgi:hypothetical protein